LVESLARDHPSASGHPDIIHALARSLARSNHGTIGGIRQQPRLTDFGAHQGLTHVSPGDAVRLINRSAHVIDVRPAEAFGDGHIANSRNIELASLEADPNSVKKKKDKVLLTVCDSGQTSGKAAAVLRKAGYENSFSLRGGIQAWRAENLPLAK
jgi:rhodanese-related sulfurtransferase